MRRRSSQSLEEAYFEWLLAQVHVQHGAQTYRELYWELYKKEFIPILAYDDNRAEDGMALLVEWIHDQGLDVEIMASATRGCSFLELVIGLSRRLAFMDGGDPAEWAWTLLGNLGFHSSDDPLNGHNRRFIDETLDRVIHRTYRPDGGGGLFPLAFPTKNQRKVELWYQMNAYLEENQDPHDMVV